MPPKRKAVEQAAPEPGPGATNVEIIALGAASEVGRSCVVVKYAGRTIMFDCGIHPGKAGLSSLPYFDEVDLSTVDVALITHFHLDHCAALPYLVGKTKFKGRIIMTHPTKHVYHALLKDFVKVSKGFADEQLYGLQDLEASMQRIEVCDFHQTMDVCGMRVTAYRAGHVLGAAMFLADMDGMQVLYTGDYSRIPDRHLPAADLPPCTPHIVIVESTYGVSNHSPRQQRETQFLQQVRRVVERGGRCLLPVVALGRAQELLLMLEEYWARNPALHGVPIYQASGMARRALTVYQAYIEMMNDDIKKAFQRRNPFDFAHVKHLESSRSFDDVGSCVVMATPSMLQSGVSRELFESWVEDKRNGVIICDFAVQGTLARDLLDSPATVMTRAGTKVPLRMSVATVSFSAHADCAQTTGFLNTLKPPHVVLVHGEKEGMLRLRRSLEQQAQSQDIPRTMHTPKIAEVVRIPFAPVARARVVGRLAEAPPKPDTELQGVLVKEGGRAAIMHPDDLPLFTTLHPGRVLQRQAIALTKPFSELRYALELMFEGVEGSGDMGGVTSSPGMDGELCRLTVGGCLTVIHKAGAQDGKGGSGAEHVVVEWFGGAVGDLTADAAVAIILQGCGEPARVSAAEQARSAALAAGDEDAAVLAELVIISTCMEAQFGPARVEAAARQVVLQVDDQQLIIDHKTEEVHCNEANMGTRVHKAYRRICAAMKPCSITQ